MSYLNEGKVKCPRCGKDLGEFHYNHAYLCCDHLFWFQKRKQKLIEEFIK